MCVHISTPPQIRPHIAKQILRFPKTLRRRLGQFEKTSRRYGDLMISFPAAAYSMAAAHTSVEARALAVTLVREGAKLTQIGEVLDLPMWTKKLPPEAFEGPLDNLPQGEKATRRLAGCIPENPRDAAQWLRAVRYGVETCNSDFAIWLAKQPAVLEGALAGPAGMCALAPLAAFAWASSHGPETLKGTLTTRWSPKMRFNTAVVATQEWMHRLIRRRCAGSNRKRPTPAERRAARSASRRSIGLSFEPLTTAEDLKEEGQVMNHCVEQYTTAVMQNTCFIFSVRKGARRVGTMELRPGPSKLSPGRIAQFLGPNNVTLSERMWREAREWVEQRRLEEITSAKMLGQSAVHHQLWAKVWTPYWNLQDLKGREQWPSEKPTALELEELGEDLATLMSIRNC